MLRTRSGLSVGIFALAAGCGGTYTPTSPGLDMATKLVDMATKPADLGPTSDIAMLQPDMTTTMPIPPGCDTTTVVSGTQAYATITSSTGMRCMGAGCHNNGTLKPQFNTQATFMTAMAQNSTATMPYVTPNNPDQSYLLYKLRGLQTTVRNGGGAQMPRTGTLLTNAEICTVYNWVLHSAPSS